MLALEEIELKLLTSFHMWHCKLTYRLEKFELVSRNSCWICTGGSETPIHILTVCGTPIWKLCASTIKHKWYRDCGELSTSRYPKLDGLLLLAALHDFGKCHETLNDVKPSRFKSRSPLAINCHKFGTNKFSVNEA